MIRRVVEVVERGDRSLRLPRGRQTTHGTMWMVVVAAVAAAATMVIASSHPMPEPASQVVTLDVLEARINAMQDEVIAGRAAAVERVEKRLDEIQAQIAQEYQAQEER